MIWKMERGKGEIDGKVRVRASEKAPELRASDWFRHGSGHSVLQSFTAASFTTPFTGFVCSFVRLLRGRLKSMYLYEWSQAHYQFK